MESILISKIFENIVEHTVSPIVRQVGYVINYKSNLQNLRSQVEDLKGVRDRTQHAVDDDKRKRNRRVETDVQNWLEKVDEITQEADTLLETEGHAKTKCLNGICTNLISYHQLSRKSTKLMKRIEEKKNPCFESVSYHAPVEDINTIPSAGYMPFKSRISMGENILKALKNSDTNVVGVYGFDGVGKTTFAKEVYRMARKDEYFDDVVIIILDEKQDPEKIQKEIAAKLQISFDESESMAGRASCLWDRIKDKKTLVILDEVLERIDLESLGLLRQPPCNVLLTSRDENVLSFEMKKQKNFPLGLLRGDETWSLFEKMAGDVVKDDRIRKLATQVAKKCGGLPVLVIAVASALRSASTLEEWKDALRRFKRFGEKKKAYCAIEWSYKKLDPGELQPLFLLCGLIAGESCTIFISDLLKYTMGLGLMKNVNTVEAARDALVSHAKKLKDSCLLLDNNYEGSIRMHELVRDIAMEIASNNGQHVFKAYGDELKEWPNEDFLKKCTAISVRSCKIPRLPEEPWVCPELRFIILENDDINDSLEIPSNYFEGMNKLEVLDVTKLRILSLPPSLKSLTKLQTLCLDMCVLGDIALVGKLTHLKILSLIHSQVKELPEEISQLTSLQLLDLTNCSDLVRISPGVISSLTRLEDLRMGINSFKQWEGEGVIGGRSNASVSELKHLSQLTALDIHIPDANLLPANLLSDKLERYTILVGDCWLYPKIYGTSSNMVKFKLAASNQFDQGIKSLLKKCEHLYLDGMEAENIISDLLDSDGVKQLKCLHVQNNDKVRYVIDSNRWSYSHNAFPNLESLSLYNVVSLESVCYGQLIAEPFQQLRRLTLWNLPKLIGFNSKGKQLTIDGEADEITLEVEPRLFKNEEVLMPNLTHLILHQCDGLRILFSSSMARSLQQLKHLEISKCQIMEEIVSTSENGQEHTDKMFCKLKHLQLQYLPSFTRFCSGHYIEFPSLELLHIEDCPKLGTFIFNARSESITIGKQTEERDSKENLETVIPYFLFDEKVGFPSLESLIIYDLPKLMTLWHHQLAPGSFSSLRKVELLRCHNLINIFAPSMIGRLSALDTLNVWHCQSLQVVFELRAALDVEETSTTQLKRFECPKLNLVQIDSCESLKTIFPASVAKGLQQLTKLEVENCGLDEIVAKEVGSETLLVFKFMFPKVTYVKFENLPQLRVFYPGRHISEWPLLQNLMMLGCGNVEIFVSEFSKFPEKLELGLLSTPIKPFFLVDKVLMRNLTRLVVGRCDGLRFLFSPSMAGSLVQLKDLYIFECQIMEEIVPRNESSQENTDHNMFCQLKHLELRHLPNLTRFCSAKYIKFTSLELLNIHDCTKLETFLFDPMSTNNTTREETEERDSSENTESVVPYFLFDEKVEFPSLETLIIHEVPKLRTIWHNQLAPDSFPKLKKVNVFKCHSLRTIFVSSMMGGLNALHTLDIKQCQSLQVVFEEASSTTQLKSFECPYLDSVLIVSCESLKNIFPASVAKCLQQLTILRVESCGILEEIVAKEELAMTPEFVLPKVRSVRFDKLPQLRSFYSELHVSKWPSLSNLAFLQCSSVEIFASEFSKFQEKLDLGLQTPIKQPFFLSEKELMHLGNYNSQPADPEFPQPEVLTTSALSFRNLTALEVWNCNGLKYLTTYSVAKCLQQLKTMEVEFCERMIKVVASDGDDSENEIAFKSLQHLKLSSLKSLQGFCSGNCNVKVPSLDNLIVSNCLIKLWISPDGLLQSDSKPETLEITEAQKEEEESTVKEAAEKEEDEEEEEEEEDDDDEEEKDTHLLIFSCCVFCLFLLLFVFYLPGGAS
ncbi:hypothetical protein ACE6H2_010588 [Prunus campanulata]